MQLYELEKRMTMNVKTLAKEHGIKMDDIYINIQTSKGAYGSFSKKRWIMGEQKKMVHELALNPEHFSEPLEVVDTIIHELVHVYCDQNQIKDTSRGGYYHNKKFKKVAENFGLLCIATKAGWNTTSKGNEQKLEEINSNLPYPITGEMIRRSTEKPKRPSTPRKKKHKYTCGVCGKSFTSKDLIYATCDEDGYRFDLDPEDEEYENWLDHE